MNRPTSQRWMIGLAVAAVLAAASVIMWVWPKRIPGVSVERSMASVPTVSRANSEHELAALEKELEKNPDHAPILLRMAQVERDLGRTEDLIRHLKAAVELEPDDHEARLELGRALYQTGDLEGAIDETLRIVGQDPENVDALYNLGAIYGNMMDDARAREYWERAVALDPDSESGLMAARGLAQLSPTP